MNFSPMVANFAPSLMGFCPCLSYINIGICRCRLSLVAAVATCVVAAGVGLADRFVRSRRCCNRSNNQGILMLECKLFVPL